MGVTIGSLSFSLLICKLCHKSVFFFFFTRYSTVTIGSLSFSLLICKLCHKSVFFFFYKIFHCHYWIFVFLSIDLQTLSQICFFFFLQDIPLSLLDLCLSFY